MATTPEDAAKASAPNAQVTPQQPAQPGQTAPTTVVTPAAPVGPAVGATQAGANGGTSVQPTAKVGSTEVNRGTAATDAAAGVKVGDNDGKVKAVQAGREEEQKVGKELDAANADSDYFQAVANDDAVFNDPTRQAHRQMRAQEAEEKKGDPTRDPVAKQEAMDMNTPQPGAVEEARKIAEGDVENTRSK